MNKQLEELKAAALAATPQKIDGAQEKTEDGCMECPCCSGEGQVDVGADYCNYDNTALGVIFYGIGDAHVAAERYFRAANPAVVLALLEELEAKDKRITELEGSATLLTNQRDLWYGKVQDLEAKLATPVRLPNKNDAEFWFDGVFQVAKFDRAVERAIRAAGFTVEGDE
ncbi:ead/Ea22-like family protein [Serratia odorifera]|uniref:ead/Ea22-like family protein n=1 Tax=Serratia odorifera TaxID=618 RepID=UPI0035320305